MPTSNERRKIAKRLRREADGYREFVKKWPEACRPYIDYGDAPGYVEDIAVFIGVVQGERRIYPTEDLFDRLADLIDPTCEVMEVPDNDEFMIRVVSGFMCKRCGHEAIVERNCDGSAEPPNYCPHCGARVTDGGER